MHYNVEFLASSRRNERYTTIRGDSHNNIRTDQWAEIRLNRIAEVIRASSRHLPEVLVLSEVMDFAAAERLAKKLGYARVLSTFASPGIGSLQVVMVRPNSNAKIISKHEIPVFYEAKTLRPILEVEIRVGTQSFILYANHWPSSRKGMGYQLAAARALKNAISAKRFHYPSIPILAVGDFNMPEPELHPAFREILTQSHSIKLHDLDSEFANAVRQGRVTRLQTGPGTHFYHPMNSWSFLDRVFFSSEFKSQAHCFRIDLRSYRIPRPRFALEPLFEGAEEQVPHRFITQKSGIETFDELGYSDHLPLTFSLDFSNCAE